ncbi:hypothetical protein AAMO2058_000563100 [Amorphochlora amoebiformis]
MSQPFGDLVEIPLIPTLTSKVGKLRERASSFFLICRLHISWNFLGLQTPTGQQGRMYSSVAPRKVKIVYHTQPPRIWYKDQAHEPKFFDVCVVLKDERGSRVRGLDVPVRAFLLYDNGGDVKRQNILKISKDSVPKIGKSGVADLKIRIDSVSKNHDNHDFMVRIAADPSFVPPELEVLPAASQPITVRSKRNRGKRKKHGGAGIDTDSLTAIASWCRYANNTLDELACKDVCPCCNSIAPHHDEACKLHKCVMGFMHIRGFLESKFTEPKKPKVRQEPILRFPQTDLKRNRSPALKLENLMHAMHTPPPVGPPASIFGDFSAPPPLLKTPVLGRKRSG